MQANGDPHVSQTSPSDWKYVAEGGATLVVAWNGPPSPELDRTVLRLRKADVDTLMGCPEDSGPEPDDPIVEFQAHVVGQLVSPDYLPHLRTVTVERAWLEELAALAEAWRPHHRRGKDRIDVRRRKAVLATDCIGGEGWAVEIKPKWGFLPSPFHLSPETREIKTRTCRLCMHTHFKTSGKNEMDYCPLDLYSGDPGRMTVAIHGLWDDWVHSRSSNNLRVFVRGQTINSKDETSLLTLASALLPINELPTHAILRDYFTQSLLRLLLSSPVLATLSHLQRSLDALDVEGLHTLLLRSGANFSEDSTATGDPFYVFSEPDIPAWESFVETYLSPDAPARHDDPSPADARYYLLAYLLSMTFKDCSIVLKLDPDEPSADCAKVIDLDSKPMKKLRHWEELDRAIVQAYAGLPEDERRICVDAGLSVSRSTKGALESLHFLIIVTLLVTIISFLLP